MEKSWFASWFDSRYYHILYKNRDDNEAQLFIQNLVNRFEIRGDHYILDLACGKGRHSKYLNSLGMNVLGVDLSENSIHDAKQFENATLHFEVHDMRKSVANNTFDFVLNLFTSFGYFDNDSDNLKTILAIKESLKTQGVFIIDFFNTVKVVQTLIPHETKVIDGIEFEIKKRIDKTHILKQINFTDKGENYSFTEKVQYFYLSDFVDLFNKAGLEIIQTFGSYSLQPFIETTSDRLILACKKKSDF